MEQILITRANTTVELINSSATITSIISAEHRKAALGEDVVVMDIETAVDRAFSIGDSIKLFGGNTYKINQLPSAEKISQRKFRYNLVFEGIQYDLLRVLYRNEDVSSFSTSSEFALTGDIEMFLNVLINNANRTFGANKWALGEFPTGTETKNLLFSNENCLTVLQRICAEYSYEFTFTETSTQKILNVKRVGSELDFTFEYGKGKGLYNLKRDSVDSKKIINKLFVYGSTKNIPANYKNYSQRLHFGTVSPFTESVVSDSASIASFGVCEGSIIFDDVFPTGFNSVTAINTSNRLEFTDSSMSFDLNAKDGSGNTLHLIPGVTAKVHFNTGNLAGYEFEIVKYTHSTRKFILKAVEGEKGLSFPSLTEAAFQMAIGDSYSLIDVVMPQSLIDAAESLLQSKGVDYLNENKAPIVKYTVAIDEEYLKSKTSDLNIFNVGDSVVVKDSDFGINTRIKIISFSRNVLYPYRYSIVVSDVPEIGALRTLAVKANEADRIIRHNGLNDPIKFKQDPKSNAQIQSQIDETINRKPSVLIGRDSTNVTIGNKENQTLVEILGRLGIRNTNNFLGEFSVADLTANTTFVMPNNSVGGVVNINDWNYITNKPTTVLWHNHQISDIENLVDALAGKQPLNGNLTSLGLLNTNGIVRRSGTNTFVIGTNDPITLTGDVTGTGTTSIAVTLADSGVTSGTYRSVTVDAKGRVTNGTNPTTISGYGITDFDTYWNTRWNTVKGLFVDFGGSVAVSQTLTVEEDLFVFGKLYDSVLEPGSASGKQVLRSTSTGFLWTSLDKSYISDFSSGVLGQVLTGLSTGSNTPITSSNTILTGFQNLQAQISAKANALSGTANYLPKFTSSSTIGNSLFFDNGTNTGVGTASPLSALHINAIPYAVSQDGGITLSTAGNEIYGAISLIANSAGSPRFAIKPPAFGGPVIEALTITDFGFVGINKIEPTQALDVDGNIKGNNLYLSNHLLLNNSQIIYAKNSSGDYEGVLFGRFSDNGTYLDGGTGGLHLRTANGAYEGIFINNVGNATFNYIPSCAVTPTSANHLVNKGFVDSLSFLKRGESVKTISFTTIFKLGLLTINGYTLEEGDLVLDAGGSSEGGVWVASSGYWGRSTLNDSDAEIRGAYHYITNGTYANSRYINTNTSAITLDTTPITYDVDFGAEADPVWTAFKTANDLTSTRIGNWNTAYSWGNHTNLYVDKSTTQNDIGGAKKFTTSIQSPIVKAGTDSLFINLFNYFGTAPRIASNASLEFFSTGVFSWYTTGDLGRMRLTTTGLRVGDTSNANFALDVAGQVGFSNMINLRSPYTGEYSNGTDGQVIMRKSVAGVLNFNQWTTLAVEHISDIATYYQAKITATENYLTKKTATNFGDSQIFDNGTLLAIGGTTAIDGSKFSVIGKLGATTARIGDDTDGINIDSLAINSTGALGYGATSHVWNVSSTEKMSLNGSRLALAGNFELTGKLKLNGSFGGDHYFAKSLGVDGSGNPLGTEWAIMNCGEISDIADLYFSKAEADTSFIRRVTDEGERGFFMYGDTANTVKEGFFFTNPDTGIMGIHGYRLEGSTIQQYGFQLAKDGLPYWLFPDGARKRILTEADVLSGGGGGTTYTLADPLYFAGNQINIKTASATQAGVLSSIKYAEFDAKLRDGSSLSTGLTFNSAVLEFTGSTTTDGILFSNGGVLKASMKLAPYFGQDTLLFSTHTPNTEMFIYSDKSVRINGPLNSGSTMTTEVYIGQSGSKSFLQLNGSRFNFTFTGSFTPTNGQKFCFEWIADKNGFFLTAL